MRDEVENEVCEICGCKVENTSCSTAQVYFFVFLIFVIIDALILGVRVYDRVSNILFDQDYADPSFHYQVLVDFYGAIMISMTKVDGWRNGMYMFIELNCVSFC